MVMAALVMGGVLRAQDKVPASRYVDFLDSNNVRPYVGFYHTLFKAGSASGRQPRLQANTSAYLGAALNYKWFSIYYALNIPRTSVLGGDNKTVKASQLIISHWWNHWGLEGSYQHDRGLVDQDDPGGPRMVNSVWQWADYKYLGVNVDYFFNPSRFSYRAADNFARRQARSGGSWLLMITPSYQDFNLQRNAPDTSIKDSTLYNLLTKDANHLVLLAKVGYTYAFSWDKGRWTCSPLFCIGPGAGVYLDQFHTHQRFYPNLGYQGRLTAGYNGDKWYCYLSGLYDLVQEPEKNLGLKTINESASLSVGYRFHSLRRRILGVL